MSRRYEIAPISDEEIKAEERRVFFSENGDDSAGARDLLRHIVPEEVPDKKR